jgi:hypothetical protein
MRTTATAVVFLSSILSACGGGSGSTSNVLTLELSSNAVAYEAPVNGTISQQTVNLNLANFSNSDSVYLIGRFSTNGIDGAGFDVTGALPVSALQASEPLVIVDIEPRAPNTLKPGTYQDTIQIQACTDSACAHPIAGSPQTIVVNYTVEPVTGSDAPQLTLATNTVSAQAFLLSAQPPANAGVAATITNYATVPNITISYTTHGVSFANLSYTSAASGGGSEQGALTIQYAPPNQLGVGTYNDVVTINACLDPQCVNPFPGSPFTVNVSYTVTSTMTGAQGLTANLVTQETNDIVWDPVHRLIYASIPATATANPNSIVSIDPVTLVVGTPIATGSDPGTLAVSDDGQFLYVGLREASAVQRFVLPALTPDITIPIAPFSDGTAARANEIQVAPGSPHTIAVAESSSPSTLTGETGLAIFDDSTERPNTVSTPFFTSTAQSPIISSIQWSDSTSTLYGYDGQLSTGDASIIAVDANGVTVQANAAGVATFAGLIHLAGGLMYTDAGTVYDPGSFGVEPGFPPLTGDGSMVPDLSGNIAFILDDFHAIINSYDLSSRAAIASLPLPGFIGGTRLPKLIAWGTNGLAAEHMSAVGKDQILLISGPFIGP